MAPRSDSLFHLFGTRLAGARLWLGLVLLALAGFSQAQTFGSPVSLTNNSSFSVTCISGTDFCSMTPATCAAGSTCSFATVGFATIGAPGGENLLWSGDYCDGQITDACVADYYPGGSITLTDPPPFVTLTRSAASISETGGTATLTATLSKVWTSPVTVNLGFSGTAVNGADYNPSATSITVPVGSISGTITLSAAGDTIDEFDETVVTDITSITNGLESGTQQVSVTITDDDPVPTATLSLTGGLFSENGGAATLTANLSSFTGKGATINLAYSGTATFGSDYSAPSSINIPAGSNSGSVTISSIDDSSDEPNETVVVDIAGTVNATESGTQQVTATMTDDDPPPVVTLAVAPGSFSENGGTATVTASLSTPSAFTVNVDLGFSGTAIDTGDYSRSSASISISPGSISGSITLTAIDDALDEPDETVVIDIVSLINGTETGTEQVTATITDDDPTPLVTLGLSGSPLAENGGSATVSATLSAPSASTVVVALGFSGTATSGSDYTASGASISIPSGSTSGTVSLTGLDDGSDELDETIIVDVANVTNGAEDGTQQVTATITDDDPPPTVALGLTGSPLAENGGVATVTAALSAVSSNTITVGLAFSGTATAGTDYVASGATITINPGASSGSISLMGSDDALSEPDETIVVDINSVTNGTEDGVQQVTATVADDDAPPTVGLDTSPISVGENGGTSTVTATLSTPSASPVTVNLGFSGTATNGADYNPSATAITINAGSTTGSISIGTVNDALDELDETVIVDIVSVTNADEDGVQQNTVTIVDDDPAPSVALSLSGSPLAENGGVATVTATLSAVSGLPVTVDLGFGGTAAGGGTDYGVSGLSISIAAGSTSGSMTLTGVDDAIDELDETVVVDITNVTNGSEDGIQQVTATIIDDDAPPTVALGLSGSPLAENGGMATITATLSSVSGLPVTVDLGYTGTATSGADYLASTVSINIPAGSAAGSVTITGVDDIVYELDETVVVDIANVTNGIEDGTQQVTVTITDDEPVPTVALTSLPTSIGENGATSTVTATLSGPAAASVIVDLGFSGTATNGTDFNPSGTSITINAGSTSGTASVTTVDDALDELDETVIVDIVSVTNADEDGEQQNTVTIVDDDPAPTVALSLAGSPLAENGGLATVTATLSSVSGLPVTVDLGFGGTATGGGTDYGVSGASISIAAGSTSGSVTMTGVDDTNDELDETVLVDITNVTNGSEDGTQQVTATITDDDPPPAVSLGASAMTFDENGGSVTITATMSRMTYQPVEVTLALTGTATQTSDYTASSVTLTVPAGSTSAAMTLTGVDDAIDEDDETVVVDIQSVTNGTEDGSQQVTVTIIDDETPPAVTLGVIGSPAAEAGGMATITATLSGPSASDVTVSLVTSGTATQPDDYTLSSTEIVIAAGDLNGTATVTGVDDALDEADETVDIDIDAVTNGVEDGTQQVTVILVDDDATPQASLGGAVWTESDGPRSLTVNLTGASSSDIDIAFDTSDGTAVIGVDATLDTPSPVTVPAGSTAVTIDFTVVDDALNEVDETFTVTLTSATPSDPELSATVEATPAEVTITDDDLPPEISLSLSPTEILEEGGAGSVCIGLSAPSGQRIVVTLEFGGLAILGTDYSVADQETAVSGIQVVVPIGALQSCTLLSAIDDELVEPPEESILISVQSVTNAVDNAPQTISGAMITGNGAEVISVPTLSPIGLVILLGLIGGVAWRQRRRLRLN